MLIQALGCGFQNEATITAAIQMPLDLTFYARRELPFQVPTSQMDRIPTGHRSPAFSGPAWVGPFSSRRGCNKIWRKAVQIGTPGLAFAGRWNEGLSGLKCDIYSAGCRKPVRALSTKAAAAFTSRAQATQTKNALRIPRVTPGKVRQGYIFRSMHPYCFVMVHGFLPLGVFN